MIAPRSSRSRSTARSHRSSIVTAVDHDLADRRAATIAPLIDRRAVRSRRRSRSIAMSGDDRRARSLDDRTARRSCRSSVDRAARRSTSALVGRSYRSSIDALQSGLSLLSLSLSLRSGLSLLSLSLSLSLSFSGNELK